MTGYVVNKTMLNKLEFRSDYFLPLSGYSKTGLVFRIIPVLTLFPHTYPIAIDYRDNKEYQIKK